MIAAALEQGGWGWGGDPGRQEQAEQTGTRA